MSIVGDCGRRRFLFRQPLVGRLMTPTKRQLTKRSFTEAQLSMGSQLELRFLVCEDGRSPASAVLKLAMSSSIKSHAVSEMFLPVLGHGADLLCEAIGGEAADPDERQKLEGLEEAQEKL
jgi:hypothetical protein